MRSLILVLFTLILVGCETVSKLESIETPHSRLVYVRAYDYHGSEVAVSRNWLLGRGTGLGGLSEYKMDLPTNNMGIFFKSAVDEIDVEDEKKSASSKPEIGDNSENNVESKNDISNFENSSLVCSEVSEKEYLLGEWTLYYDSDSVRPNNLQDVLSKMVSVNPTEVSISGYTDDVGNDLYNLNLSKKRALNAKASIQHVWETNNYNVTWGGECPRAVLNIDAASRALNRRVIITAYNTPIVDAAISSSEGIK